jgi:hypothetical protein
MFSAIGFVVRDDRLQRVRLHASGVLNLAVCTGSSNHSNQVSQRARKPGV